MKKNLVFTFFMLSISILLMEVRAQKGLNFPEGISADEKEEINDARMRFSDAVQLSHKTKDINLPTYKEAARDLFFLLNKAPKLYKALYQKGVKLYEELANLEKDKKKKIAYQDSVLYLFDQRIKLFGEKEKVLNLKAYNAYYFLYDKTDRYGELHKYFKEAWEANKENIYPENIEFWFQILTFMKTNNSNGYYSKYEKEWAPDVITPIFDDIIIAAEKNIAKNDEESKKWIATRTSIENNFRTIVPITCDMIKQYMEPKYRKNPDDIEMIKEMINVMQVATRDTTKGSGKCVAGDALYLELAEKLFKNEPTYKRANYLRKAHTDPAKRNEFRNKALEMAENNEQKSAIYLELANENVNSNYPTARKWFLLAAQNNPSVASRCYTAIGDMYLKSGGQCSGGSNPLEKKAFAIAAYNMYVKAGNGAKQNLARKYYPSKELIFQYAKHQGKAYTLPCWIGETVILPKL